MSRPARTFAILITDHPAPNVDLEAAVLGAVKGRLIVAKSGNEAELLQLAPDADAILTCFAQVPSSVLVAAPRLQVIGRYGVGVDNIAVNTATERGVIVANVPAYCVDEVAEHAIALLLALARRITRYDRAVRSGNWTLATGMPIHRLAGQSLGIIGFGRIGRAMAARGRALGLRVIAFDPRAPDTIFTSQNVQRATLDQLLAESDFISLHTLLSLESVIATPHVAFYSEESIGDLQRLAAENVAAVLEGRLPTSVVNPAVLQMARWADLAKGANS